MCSSQALQWHENYWQNLSQLKMVESRQNLRKLWESQDILVIIRIVYIAPTFHSSTLAWGIPWTEEPGRLQSMGSQRVGHDWVTSLSLFTFMHWRRKMATHSSVLAWRIPGMVEPGGLLPMVWHRVGHDWSDLAAATFHKDATTFSRTRYANHY